MAKAPERQYLIPRAVREYAIGFRLALSKKERSEEFTLAVTLRRARDCSARSLEILLERPVGVEYIGILHDLMTGEVKLHCYDRLGEFDGGPDYLPAVLGAYWQEMSDPRFAPFFPTLLSVRLMAHARHGTSSPN